MNLYVNLLDFLFFSLLQSYLLTDVINVSFVVEKINTCDRNKITAYKVSSWLLLYLLQFIKKMFPSLLTVLCKGHAIDGKTLEIAGQCFAKFSLFQGKLLKQVEDKKSMSLMRECEKKMHTFDVCNHVLYENLNQNSNVKKAIHFGSKCITVDPY